MTRPPIVRMLERAWERAAPEYRVLSSRAMYQHATHIAARHFSCMRFCMCKYVYDLVYA